MFFFPCLCSPSQLERALTYDTYITLQASSTIGVLAGLTNQRLVCSVNAIATKKTKLIKISADDIRDALIDKHMRTRLIRTISLRLQRVLFTTLTGYFGLTTGLFKTENFVALENDDVSDKDNIDQRIARVLGIESSELPPSVTIQQRSSSDDEHKKIEHHDETKHEKKSMSAPSSPVLRKRHSSTEVDSPLVLASTRTKASFDSKFVKEIIYLKTGDQIISPGDAPVLYVVIEGRVDVFIGDTKSFSVQKNGSVGWLSVLTGNTSFFFFLQCTHSAIKTLHHLEHETQVSVM